MKIGFKLWVLIFFLFLSLLAISPSFKSGIIIKTIEKNSSALEQGLKQGMIIEKIDSQEIKTIQDYNNAISEIFSQDSSSFKKVLFLTDEGEIILYTDKTPEITVAQIPRTKIKTGLDLSGGARALIQPSNISVSASEISDLIAITQERFNVYGISDISIRPVKDLEGNNFMLVEIAGATPTDLKELIGKQGKFDAKIGNQTVFSGGKEDIGGVCRNDATCSRIESCFQTQEGEACRFSFVVYLSESAAKRHANITSELGVNITEQGRYLEKKLDLYLDDVLVDSLFISEDLKGRITTQIAVSGSGFGSTTEQAFNNAKENMHKLQTILITGSLPYKLEIVKLDTISPILGQKFINYLLLAGLSSLLAVALIVFIRYRNFKSSIAILLTSFSEIFIILGFASLIKWNLDLASIAGILVVIGTGVDQQIILIDESRSKTQAGITERIKRALFIIVGAYFTSLAALIPLYWVGAGLLRGFAITTIIGITTGVLITRPAFAEILKRIEG
ncbi:MAG: preprotein translocase subunit SecD [Nanoarchaeota archaeon]|nr:preprotein translocase subunit SecD [Nanoarchaeota archaeon]